MRSNPVIKPKLATPALILASVAVLILAGYFLTSLSTGLPFGGVLMLCGVALLSAVAAVGALWLTRFRRRRGWMMAAEHKWHQFDDARRSHRTTTEITVLSVDALEPSGSWITINWNRFDHVQQAWIEALPDSIWPGSVLLISPDPSQVKPGLPWPQTYYISGTDMLAWAPRADSIRKLRKFPDRAHRW